MAEQWRPIPGFDPRYEVSDLGRVRSWTRRGGGHNYGKWADEPKILKAHPRNLNVSDGYPAVRLSTGRAKWKTVGVHQAVLLAFVGEPPKGQLVRHLNGNPWDNRLGNLAYGTYLQNEADKRAHGTTARGERSAHAKLTDEVVRLVRAEYSRGGVTHKELGRRFGVSKTSIGYAIRGQTWRNVE